MGSPFREIQRLELILLDFDGLEAFSVSTRAKDFIDYYFSRFIKNIRYSFKDFSQSELELLSKRYERQLELTLKDPLLVIEDLRIPIPKGMILSYHQTLVKLVECLENINAERLSEDLSSLINLIYVGTDDSFKKPIYAKTKFEQDKKIVGALYNPNNLSYTLGKHALVTLEQTRIVKDMLLSLTRDYYPKVIELSKNIDSLERIHQTSSSPIKGSSALRDSLMDMAYRISMFSIVMDHIQTMEHAFVTMLQILKNISHRTE